eukprot:16439388-Heterocapsa_arctica.AAC.1
MHERARPRSPPSAKAAAPQLRAEERLDAESAGDETVSALDHAEEPSEWSTNHQGASPSPTKEAIAKPASQAGGGRRANCPPAARARADPLNP